MTTPDQLAAWADWPEPGGPHPAGRVGPGDQTDQVCPQPHPGPKVHRQERRHGRRH